MKCTHHYLLLFLCFGLLTCSQEPEEVLILNHGKILNELHQRNIGQVAFMSPFIPFDQFQDSDKLTQLQLAEETELSMRVFLEHTQTHYLHELAPDLSPNELCAVGNWQMRFFLDDEFIYEENLSPGAGSCSYRNEQTVIGIPLKSPEQQDHWGWYLWTKFMKKGGGEKVLASGSHLLRLEVRPYLETEEILTGPIVAKGEIVLSREQIAVAEADIAVQPIAPSEQWKINPAGIDSDKIRELNTQIAQRRFKQISSIVAVYDQQLVLEEYFEKTERESLHDTRSVGKSFASAMLGIAIEDGHIKDEHQTLGELYDLTNYDNPSPAKAAISLQQLLTMSSALAASDKDMDSPGQEEHMYPTKNWIKFCLGLPINENKVGNPPFDYNSVSSVIIGDVVQQAVPGGLEAYTQAKLFDPLQISQHQWQYTPEGTANTAGSLQLSSLDLAKFGVLYQNGGQWNGQRILPQAWTEKSLSPVVTQEEGGSDGYGYFFWHKTVTHNGKSYPVAHASGNGGNKIFIFRDFPLVVVVTATAYGQAWAHFQADQVLEEYIFPAVLAQVE